MTVYGLKRATPRMKYQHMRMVMDFRANLKEEQERELEHRRECRDKFQDALLQLKMSDPNWERWYDDDRNIPQHIRWNENDIAPILYRMETRIMHVEIRDEQPYLFSCGK